MKSTLVDFRNSKKMTQREMSSKLGITLTLYSKVELGIRNPSYNFLKKFKNTFKEADIDEIFFENTSHDKCN
jgi:transcriptional regulator with XRE-family HTH domain